jgi:hypothetical protein
MTHDDCSVLLLPWQLERRHLATCAQHCCVPGAQRYARSSTHENAVTTLPGGHGTRTDDRSPHSALLVSGVR